MLDRLRRLPKPSPAMAVALLALLVAASGVAVANIPSANGTVTVCYNNSTKALRVVDAEQGATCDAKKETKLGLASVDTSGKVEAAKKADTATDAGTLDGLDSKDFLPASGSGGFLGSNLFGPAAFPNGEFPQLREQAFSDETCTMGEVRLWAGIAVPKQWRVADGSLLPINQNQALFSLLGDSYGGDGRVTFALPDMTDLAPDGVRYFICTTGVFPPSAGP